ncbi:hypothetical protein HYV64_01595 [Candidatus Shapirobacteria bacterium]|nr:hypothetical protein [Candidatus Shapirobacteria bacterium]
MKNIEFQIQSLRQDKIIYAVEAAAFNLAAIVAVNLMLYLHTIRLYIILTAFAALGYTVFMAIGNLQRLRKIKQLELKL